MGKSTKAEKPSDSENLNLAETLEFLEADTKAKKEEKKKRGQYKERECPYCHVHVRNLGNHIKMKHPAEAPQPPELTKEQLVGIAPVNPQEPKPEKLAYFCNDCKAELRKGENPCWHCGANLIWDGIE